MIPDRSVLERIVIYGAGGHGREIASLVGRAPGHELAGYVEDGAPEGKRIHDVPVVSWEDRRRLGPAALVVAVGSPADRRKIVQRCAGAGLSFATLVDPSVDVSGVRRIGAGTVVCRGSVLTVDLEIGVHVHINVGCTVSHDVVIGDYSTLSPGVHVAGHVHIGEGVFFGIGACVINGVNDAPLLIGAGATIAAGACVTGPVEAGCMYAGVPARLKKRLEDDS